MDGVKVNDDVISVVQGKTVVRGSGAGGTIVVKAIAGGQHSNLRIVKLHHALYNGACTLNLDSNDSNDVAAVSKFLDQIGS